MVLDDGVVGSVVETVVAFVARDEEVECVARRLDLVDGHLLYIYCVGREGGCHEKYAEKSV